MIDEAGTLDPMTSQTRRRKRDSLFVRVALLMSLAMLPLVMISVYQTRSVIADARALSAASLLAQTVAESNQQRELVENALGAAEGFAAVVPDLDPASCKRVLSGFIDNHRTFIFAGYIQKDGLMRCSSSGDVRDFSGFPGFAESMTRQDPFVEVNPSGAVTQEHVLLVSYPVQRDGQMLGLVTVSVPHKIATDVLPAPGSEGGLKIASINSVGEIVAASRSAGAAPDYLPSGIAPKDLFSKLGTTFRARAASGEDRFYAVTSAVDDTLVIVGSWPLDSLPAEQSQFQGTVATAFPFLMWFASIAVALYGLWRLVTRHIAALRSAMRQFALGQRIDAELELDSAPTELEDTARAFNRMASLLAEAEARREQDITDKEVLLREVHHRVKNNLQLIASIINMTSRKTASDDVRTTLQRLQNRVRGMATLHRSMYSNIDATTVDAAELIEAVVRDVASPSMDTEASPTLSLESVDLYPDQAVPLSLFVSEHLHQHQNAGPVSIKLAQADGIVRLAFEYPDMGDPVSEKQPDDPMIAQLKTAFLRQLGATEEANRDGSRLQTVVSFEKADFGT